MPATTAMTHPSEELLGRASQGDRTAIEALVACFLPEIEAYIARHAPDAVSVKESAADLAQSACRELFEQLAEERFEFRGEAEFRKWLYQVAYRKIQTRERYYGAARRDARLEEQTSLGGHPVSETPSERLAEQDELARLERVLATMPDREQEVLRLSRFEGMGHAGIATRLGISEAHSRVLLSRSLAHLAQLLEAEAEQA